MSIFEYGVCGAGGFSGPFISQWIVLSVIAIFISLAILIIIYFTGKLTQNVKANVWVKAELYQLIMTAIIVVMLGTMANSMCLINPNHILPPRVGGYEDNMFSQAANYLQSLRTKSYVTLLVTTLVAWVIGFAGSFTINYLVISASPLSGLNGITTVLSTGQTMLFTTMALIVVQEVLLHYAMTAMIGIYLPLGIFLRCFEPTRKFGGTLLALAIGLSIFYPIILTFNDIAIGGTANNNIFILSIKHVIEPITIIIKSPQTLIGNYEGLKTASYLAAWSKAIIRTVFLLVSIVIYLITQVILGGVLLPIFNFAILATIVKELSRTLGSEIDISNLTRMV